MLELLEGLEHTHPHVYMDNYYTSPNLFLALYKKGVGACGTARTNRKHYPKALKVANTRYVHRGFYDYLACGPLLACVWKDKRIINLLTTIHLGIYNPP